MEENKLKVVAHLGIETLRLLNVKKLLKLENKYMEVVAEVKTLSVYMKCDKCNNGLMLENGHIILTTDPPKYPHKCNNCGYEDNYFVRYPYQKLVPVENVREMTDEEKK